MNLLESRVVLRVRSLVDGLDLAAPLCVSNHRALAPLALVVLGPAAALCLALRHGAGWSWPAVWAVVVVLVGVLEGPFTVAFGELLFQKPEQVTTGAVLRRFARSTPDYLGALVLDRLLLALATILVLPALPIAAALMFVPEAVLLERAGPLVALARSRRFVRRHVGPCVLLALSRVLIYGAGAFAAEAIGQSAVGFVFQMGQPFGDVVSHGGSDYAIIGALMAVPLAAAARFLKYVDLRTRKEGWDIQIRFLAMAATPAGAPDGGAT